MPSIRRHTRRVKRSLGDTSVIGPPKVQARGSGTALGAESMFPVVGLASSVDNWALLAGKPTGLPPSDVSPQRLSPAGPVQHDGDRRGWCVVGDQVEEK